MYARFRSRPVFYKRSAPLRAAYGVRPNTMRRLNIDAKLMSGRKVDENVDLSENKQLELLESLRHPKERDFYQDHTYHNQWVQRDMERAHKSQLRKRYSFMAPGHEIKPWIWYPGDTVEVTSGESRGQRGAIIAVIKYKNEIIVQNVNVQDVVIPATDTRPEQIVQREHPISVTMVQHVDPQSNTLCQVRMVTVRSRETGKLEEKRISLESGVLLPIPPRDEAVEVGDPLRDTPIADVDEVTYDPEKELPVLVERKLKAMESYFVAQLKESYEFHRPLMAQNETELRQFQVDVVDQAVTAAVKSVVDSVGSDWWSAEVAPLVDELHEAAAAAAAAAAEKVESEGGDAVRATGAEVAAEDTLSDEEDEEDDDGSDDLNAEELGGERAAHDTGDGNNRDR